MDFGAIFKWGTDKLIEGYEYITDGEFIDDIGDWWESESAEKAVTDVAVSTAKGFLGVDTPERSGRIDPTKVKYSRSQVGTQRAQATPVRQPSLRDMGYTDRAVAYGKRALNSQNRFIQDGFNIIRPNINLSDQTITLSQAQLPAKNLRTKYNA
jgi:hypothetical protein